MFTLRGRQDNFRLIFPKEFLCDEITEKYSKIITAKHSFITTPIDFLNETIQGIQVLGFNEGTVEQQQPGRGTYTNIKGRENQNRFPEGPTGSPANLLRHPKPEPGTSGTWRGPSPQGQSVLDPHRPRKPPGSSQSMHPPADEPVPLPRSLHRQVPGHILFYSVPFSFQYVMTRLITGAIS